MSQRELAERAGVPVTMISAYERDQRQPTLATLLRLLQAAGFGLRLHLPPYDPHDDILAGLEAGRSEHERSRRDRPDGTSLAAAETWNLICAHGEFDISFRPSGFADGYAQLAVLAHRVFVDDVEVDVADLADVIRSKESAGRPKDLRVLPMRYRHQSARSEPAEG